MGVRLEKGTAFILVVMLVTLLAVIGTMFLLRARVGRLSASAMRQNSELNNAADTVVAAISQQLVVDTPGVDPNGEYYDYPDPCNAWLANLEPYYDVANNDYRWRQISDVTGYLKNESFPTQNISVKPVGLSTTVYVNEYPVINVNSDGKFLKSDGSIAVDGVSADADGDGIADSKWIELADITTGRGEPVFAAVRVVDNGGMLNVNTGYKFDPNSAIQSDIDGSSQLQINLLALSARGSNPTADLLLQSYRNPLSNNNYERDVVWGYGIPTVDYTPFDISDELKLRNRYLLNFNKITTRIEKLWTKAYDGGPEVPLESSGTYQYDNNDPTERDWLNCVTFIEPNFYDYRHISTTYNIDRIINPFGERMVNIQNVEPAFDAQPFYYNSGILSCIDPTSPLKNTLKREFAQIVANIKDYSDSDTEVTTVIDNFGDPHYGYERPEIRISEIVYGDRYLDPNDPGAKYDPNNPIPNDPNFHRSFAIEISNDFVKDVNDFNDWRLVIDSEGNGSIDYNLPITSALFDERGDRYFVAVFQDPNAPLSDLVYWLDSPADRAKGVDPNVILRWGDIWGRDANGVWSKANAYDVYFGTDPEPESKGRQIGNAFDPFDSVPMAQGETYYWRVAGVNTVNNVVIDDGRPPWNFTTWLAEPNLIVAPLDPTSPAVFGPNSVIRLERWVPGKTTNNGYLIVDMISPEENKIPAWLVDPCDAGWTLRARSFQRDLSWPGRLKRLWNYDTSLPSLSCPTLPISQCPTLGWSNDFLWPTPLPPLQVQHYRLNNVGELGFIFKKSAYYEVSNLLERIQILDAENDDIATGFPRGIKVDLRDASVQKMFNFLTVMDPNRHGQKWDEWRVQGRININTAPWFVLAQLPWVSIQNSPILNYDLAKAIVTYRDGTGGFENIGQLNDIANIQYYGGDGFDQQGFPDLSTDRRTKVDGYADDQEERDLIFARISDLVTVRSDVFTAYVLVRLGQNGPQKRVMAILDRSDVRNVGGTIVGNVKIRSLYPVPDPH
jgi:hypothetical protein